ncbi:methyltransferase type 12 [Oleiphilus sp. HI0071]|uniref:class I SAM-dependent methyltransferase n=1 Tax=unclassified Oleiphilus TaxID=2631174 RepID=UPI0007C2F22D|nr:MULTISPECIES: 50S ribosomal protein L11 methyltransferase [unclassified Oleiphilus]KZY68028.1 methyltransferase type 12 [Oleiphilus sp. HI0065]KZY80441.1 methyltransferase type 12 [Oleiphilus sp. HI0071]KZY93070.1 methyltransferase type 12 [Oleiphilus sp. HI0073]KZZ48788.1 methyltransferase type 12 [Oleiphilus sp. HI0118]KZZ51614.1 methyltransferase type 12 [Oleiphilus sp. HI0122]KZZ67267.1 methyltransferase type 12 [Oleiphilus sp. HI0130]KZZ76654.1 methyltransferase type 12 [Oleiphilus s
MPTLLSLQEQMQRTLKKARLTFTTPPFCPQISLALFDPQVLEGPIPHDEAQAIVAEPAYWSFCWASGQVLASYILNNPKWVKGKRVVDIGSGSGVVALAAARAGAKTVWACDIDEDALQAVQVNAEHNGVELHCIKTLDDISDEIDVLTAADVLYDRDNHSLLDEWRERSGAVLLADSRMKTLPSEHFELLETHEARTWPDLNEFEEFNTVRLYRSKTR